MAAIRLVLTLSLFLFFGNTYSQENAEEENEDTDTTAVYKKRVLESVEVDFLMSFYSQDGKNAAVTGGKGTEALTDVTPTFVISIPLNDDEVLTIDAGISAYTSASSSNIDGLDTETPDPFKASSGASGGDTWVNVNASYSHSSDDRNKIQHVKLSFANEFDYFSIGFGGGHSWLFNDKNTVLDINGSVYLDKWNAIYPGELRQFSNENTGSISEIDGRQITGNTNYRPQFKSFIDEARNSYALGISFSQILSKRMQAVFLADFVQQSGLLSTPFQRVYFADVPNSYISNFHLADAIEQLPDNRSKIAIGTRINFYLNERFVLRNYYRYYFDTWGVFSHTYQIEVPIKLGSKFTLYPSYRYYEQSKSDYFARYETHLSTDRFYTSDFDLSEYKANQFGFGIRYIDIFLSKKIFVFGLKSIDLKINYYKRNTGLEAFLVAAGVKFVMDK